VPEEKPERKPFQAFFRRLHASTQAQLPHPDYRRRAATAPDALAVILPVRFLPATI
jgi:hypothetical protein